LHHYINPERDIAEGAFAVHGLSQEFLSDKPVFGVIVDELTEFIAGAEVIIHNAPFDLSFLNNEYALLKRPNFSELATKITDTLVDARRMFPGKRNSLDALCERYGISKAHRSLHGALLDARLLADVYLAMTRGQESLEIGLSRDGQTRSRQFSLKKAEIEGRVVNQHFSIADKIEKICGKFGELGLALEPFTA
ncbi:MAG: DNA polymerase III subunit epsilon, partial [Betaproteobacteria bacterium]|nr:DNA polymerase III subunit epsilon [Betaproteobacteria bacterium]